MEEEDDEGFGDFKFASFPSQVTVHTQSKGPNPSTVDDQWGDFVHPPGPARSEPPPPSDPFAFFTDQAAKSELPTVQWAPSQDSGMPKGKTNPWEKPKGALPLSIFGEAEEESDVSVDPAAARFFSSSNGPHVKNESKLSATAGINDLISNLYNQNSSIKTGNGPVANFNFNTEGGNPAINKSVSTRNQSGSGSDELDFNSNAPIRTDNGPTSNLASEGWNIGITASGSLHNKLVSNRDVLNFDSNASIKTDSGNKWNLGNSGYEFASVHNQLGSKVDGLSFDLNASRDAENSNSVAEQSSLDLVSGPDDCVDDDDDDGWEFVAADFGNHVANADSEVKADRVIAENGSKSNLVELNSSSNMLSSDQTGLKTSVSSPNPDTNGLSLNFFNGNGGSGAESDTFWDFRGAESASQVGDANCKKAENHEKADFTFGTGHILQGPKDVSVVSNGASQSQWGFGFDFNPLDMPQNGSTASSYPKEELNGIANGHGSSSAGKDFNTDEDAWEFMDAGKSNDITNRRASSSAGKEEQKDLNVFSASIQPLENDSHALGASSDMFAASNEKSYQTAPLDFGFSFSSNSSSQDRILLGSYPKSNQDSLTNESTLFSANEAARPDETFWAFEHTSVETNMKQKEESNGASTSAHPEALTFDGKIQKEEIISAKKEALPLSLFSDRNLGTDYYLAHKENPCNSSTSYAETSNKSSSMSINDLIKTLYNQADQNASVDHTGKASNGRMDSKPSVVESGLIASDDEFDDSSWEFKDASCGDEDKMSSSALGVGESYTTVPSRLERTECIEFYCKLRDKLCSVVLYHAGNLKRAQDNAAGLTDNAEAAALEKEIKEVYKELDGQSSISKDLYCDQSSSDLLEVLGDLQGPKFQVLESELQLSERLSLVQKDLRLAVELFKHVELSLRILKLGSIEDQSSYASTWFKLVSVCLEELKHGACIWKQALQTNVHHQILSRAEGKKYILSLGEVYRVVALIKASVKLYKPWILFSSVEPSCMDAMFCECSTLWSSSGLEEALQSISDIVGFEYDETTKALAQSIKYIQDLDVLELQNYIFSEQEPSCRILLLKAAITSGLKLVNWNGDHYFLRLANLWGNLVSHNPPDLPRVHVL